MESDANYANDSVAGANTLTLTHGVPGHLVATVAGTIMSPEGGHEDWDFYGWGTINAGNVVELNARLPSTGTAHPAVMLVNSSGVPVVDQDGNPTDGHFLGTIPADGAYYAKVELLTEGTYGGHTYLLTDGGLTWSQAEAYAQGLGGHLVTINDMAEQQWLQTTFGAYGNVWIGMTDEATEGTWLWSSGQAASYTNWAGGQPNNYDEWWGGEADYAWMQSDGTWVDFRGDHGFRGLIELDVAGTGSAGTAGPYGQYLLDVDVTDSVPPAVTAVIGLPAQGATTANVIGSFTVTVNEDLLASTVNAVNPIVKQYNGHSYLLTPTGMTWNNAEAYAQGLGGHLATINDAAEQAWVHQAFSGYDLWIGFTDQVVEGTWAWSSGQVASYTNWAGGQPNNWDDWWGGEADYALLLSNGTWADYRADHTDWRGLIELDSVPDTDSDGVPDILDVYPNDPLNAWDLREAGADGVFDTADDVLYHLSVSPTYTSGTSIGLFIDDGPLNTGHYRFTANSTLTDRAGNALDGNRDGTGGDAYQRTFYVSLPSNLVFEGRSNNSLGSATPLPLTEDPAGSGFLTTVHGLGSIDPATPYNYWSDVDYWSFEALAGDVVSVSVDTPDSDLNPYVELRNADDGGLVGSNDEGPGADAFISHYTIATSGTYYVRVGKDYYWSGTPSSYQVHVDVARGIQLESDANYSNDSTTGANMLTLTAAGNHRLATVAGTIMSPEGHEDWDFYGWGTINAGNVVELNVRLPSTGTAHPAVMLVNSSGVPVVDQDGNPTDGHFLGTIPADGAYYAKVELLTEGTYGGHTYLLTDGGLTWSQAEAYAQGLGGHLVTINDMAEQQWLQTTFGAYGNVWIGMTDEATEGTWLWSSGQAASYTNWAGGQPNNYDEWWGGEADYASLQSDGTWVDFRGDHGFRGLIELDVAGTGSAGTAGPYGQYLLDVDVTDIVPPAVTAVIGLPAQEATIRDVVGSFTVTVSEDMLASTVNAVNPVVKQYNGHSYLLTPTGMTWGDAEAYAQSLGGHLVTINDAAEQAWVQQWFSAYDPWIGLTDQAVEGTWVWSSGQAASYTHWAGGQPNNWDDWWGGEADYGLLLTDGTWADYRADHTDWRGLIELDSATDTDVDGVPDVVDVYPNDPLNAWDLREAGTDGMFDTADDVLYHVSVSPTYTSGTSIGLFVDDGPLNTGHYRFTANRTLTDMVGNALDGNRDGTGGDAYQRTFYVSLPTALVFEGRSNNSISLATALPLTEDPIGSGDWTARGLGSLDPVVYQSWSIDVDYWSFQALAGDVVSVSVDTPDSDLNPYVELRNAADGGLVGSNDEGPGADAFISHYTIASSGTYYVRIAKGDYWSGTTGSYQVRVDVARGIQLESDANYSNDSIAGANLIEMHGVGRAGPERSPERSWRSATAMWTRTTSTWGRCKTVKQSSPV